MLTSCFDIAAVTSDRTTGDRTLTYKLKGCNNAITKLRNHHYLEPAFVSIWRRRLGGKGGVSVCRMLSLVALVFPTSVVLCIIGHAKQQILNRLIWFIRSYLFSDSAETTSNFPSRRRQTRRYSWCNTMDPLRRQTMAYSLCQTREIFHRS